MDCGAGEYRRLMQQYPLVSDAFLRLHPKFQEVIADICKRMGNGMADFIPQEVRRLVCFGSDLAMIKQPAGW